MKNDGEISEELTTWAPDALHTGSDYIEQCRKAEQARQAWEESMYACGQVCICQLKLRMAWVTTDLDACIGNNGVAFDYQDCIDSMTWSWSKQVWCLFYVVQSDCVMEELKIHHEVALQRTMDCIGRTVQCRWQVFIGQTVVVGSYPPMVVPE